MSTAIFCCVCISIGCVIGFIFASICSCVENTDEQKRAYDLGYMRGYRDGKEAYIEQTE